MSEFTIYPAIDLRAGRVVRLAQGDRSRQTEYSGEPGAVAAAWQQAGASWLHVVNLDGAFGDDERANQQALAEILAATHVRVQFGGGLRTMADIERALDLGVKRVILGTAAVEAPEMLVDALATYGPGAVGVSIDSRGGTVRVRGWVEARPLKPLAFAKRLAELGLRTAVFTNIGRDGVGSGVDIPAGVRLARKTGLQVIASGGVASLAEVTAAREAGLSGVIIGRALYERHFSLEEALAC